MRKCERIGSMFLDRVDAGKQLIPKLQIYKEENPVLLALPRGGVMVAFPIAKYFHLPLSVLIVRKIGSPENPEYGIGAVSEENVVLKDIEAMERIGLSEKAFRKLQKTEEIELERRKKVYRDDEEIPPLKGKTVLLIDDGLATGVTARAAIKAIKKHKPSQIIFVVPVAAIEVAKLLIREVQELISLTAVDNLGSIGSYYEDFSEVTDEQVVQMLSYLKTFNDGNT